jgi:hypothetical protein
MGLCAETELSWATSRPKHANAVMYSFFIRTSFDRSAQLTLCIPTGSAE